MTPPLAIVQARMGSSRLPGKVLMHVRGVPLIQRVWSTACEAFGNENVVVASPFSLDNAPLRTYVVNELGGQYFGWDGDQNDVLGRFYACACVYRNSWSDVIVRICADNPFLDPYKLKLTADGSQFSRREGGEAFTLGELCKAQADTPAKDERREHVTSAMPGRCPPPAAPSRLFSIDTQDDLDRCNALKTYVIDIDGTLCTDPPSTPRLDVIADVNALFDHGHTVILETARRSSLEAITRAQLDAWGVKYDRLRCGHKIPADYYVDNLALRPEELPHAA